MDLTFTQREPPPITTLVGGPGNNVAKATHLFKRLNAGYEALKKLPVSLPPRPTADLPNFQFSPTYLRPNFCGPEGMDGQATMEGVQTRTRTQETRAPLEEADTFGSFLCGRRACCPEDGSRMGTAHTEGATTGALPPGKRSQRACCLTFQGKFRWYTRDIREIQAVRILEEKRRRGWTSDIPN